MTKKIVQSVVKTRRTRKRSSTILWNKNNKSKNARNRIEFQRVHRVGKERGKKSRPIIAKFLRYCDREEVLFKARKLLKDKTYSVFEDMPKELYELRKAQLKKLQNAKERGDTAYFSKKISR